MKHAFVLNPDMHQIHIWVQNSRLSLPGRTVNISHIC